MPLKLVRAPDAQTLWAACADRFLAELGDHPGPHGYASHLWITHRNLRDLLFARARGAGRCGWLGLPYSFFSELPIRFEIRDRPVGLLTRRRLLSKLASRVGKQVMRRAPGRADGVIRGHMLDSLLSELLPEGVAPQQLREALETLDGDDFSIRRNRWVVEVYDQYLSALTRRDEYDDRSIHAMIATRIDEGKLPEAIGGSRILHVYGLYTPRHRMRLFEALARQTEVQVILYVAQEDEPSEFEPIATEVAQVASEGPADPRVQPAPDAAREVDWVVRQVKRALHDGACQPWEIAVVARSGQHDTRRVYRALRRAGVPATARIRTPLNQVAALKALLLVLRGAAADWDYRTLREVIAHPYFDTGVDLRAIDHLATQGRVQGLVRWDESLLELRKRLDDEDERWKFRGTGVHRDRVELDIEALSQLRVRLDPLSADRTEAQWLELCIELLRGDFLSLRQRLCERVGDRWDVVRLDQRGLIQTTRLLHEWLQLDHGPELLSVVRWYALLSRLLEANELVLSTPMHKGVQVLEAHDAAQCPFRRLFVVHANDGEFPRAPVSSIVISDEESSQLREHGLLLPDREQRLRRERALWNAVTRQSGVVEISYRTGSSGGTPMLPSLLVPAHDESSELPRTRAPRLDGSVDHEPVTEALADRLAAQTLAEAMRAQAHSGSEAQVVTIAPARAALIDQAIVAAVAETHRRAGITLLGDEHPALQPNAWNGKLRDPEVLSILARRFGPEHLWSASALEAYGRCPFVFLLERVLYIKDLAEADEETSALTYGTAAHEILERFYGANLGRLQAELTEAVAAELSAIADTVFLELEGSGQWLGLPSLWASTREQIRGAVREYLRWELPYLHEQQERPIAVEQRFGYGSEVVTISGCDVRGAPATLRVCGQIDRIDESGTRKIFHDVLDYKSGGTPPKGGYADGSTIQAALYLRVLQELGRPAGKARYRSIKGAGKTANSAEIRTGNEHYESALAFAFSIPERVRAGLFEPVKSYWSSGWKSWDIGAEITRSRARLPKGRSRFDA